MVVLEVRIHREHRGRRGQGASPPSMPPGPTPEPSLSHSQPDEPAVAQTESPLQGEAGSSVPQFRSTAENEPERTDLPKDSEEDA